METKKDYWNIVFSFGALFAIIGMITLLITDPTAPNEDSSNRITSYIALIAFIGIFIYEIKYYKNKVSELSLGTAIKLAIITGMVGGLILAFFTYFYYHNLHPEYIDFILDEGKKELAEKNYTEEEMKAQMKILKFLARPSVLASVQILSGAFYGLIGGLLGGFFYKTPQQDYY